MVSIGNKNIHTAWRIIWVPTGLTVYKLNKLIHALGPNAKEYYAPTYEFKLNNVSLTRFIYPAYLFVLGEYHVGLDRMLDDIYEDTVYLRDSSCQIAELTDEQIASIKNAKNIEEVISRSEVTSDGKLTITSGPFTGKQCTILEDKGEFYEVAIDINNTSIILPIYKTDV